MCNSSETFQRTERLGWARCTIQSWGINDPFLWNLRRVWLIFWLDEAQCLQHRVLKTIRLSKLYPLKDPHRKSLSLLTIVELQDELLRNCKGLQRKKARSSDFERVLATPSEEDEIAWSFDLNSEFHSNSGSFLGVTFGTQQIRP
jgi:hypothetical protein